LSTAIHRFSNSLHQLVPSKTPSQSGGRLSDGVLSSEPHRDRIEKINQINDSQAGNGRIEDLKESSGGPEGIVEITCSGQEASFFGGVENSNTCSIMSRLSIIAAHHVCSTNTRHHCRIRTTT
jgi:hypothetical protein